MKLNPFCMCCAINKQEKKIRDFDDADRKTEYMKKSWSLWQMPARTTVPRVFPLI